MTHVFHENLPGYHPDQLYHDDCEECEQRGAAANVMNAISNLDAERFTQAWRRAADWQRDGMRNLAVAEIPLLGALWAVQIQFEQLGISAIGELPTASTTPAPADDERDFERIIRNFHPAFSEAEVRAESARIRGIGEDPELPPRVG